MKQPATTPHSDETVLKEAAVAIGGAAGTVAALAKSVFTHPAAAAPTRVRAKKAGRIPPSNKTRLPRKQKKALAKQKVA